jgi:hypothetical protein
VGRSLSFGDLGRIQIQKKREKEKEEPMEQIWRKTLAMRTQIYRSSRLQRL